MIEKVSAKLLDYSDEQIEILSTRTLEDPEKLRDVWTRYQAGETYSLGQATPHWYAGGFGNSKYVADFEYWAKMPSFTVEEMACLSVGIAPKDFPKEVSENLNADNIERLSAPAHFLVMRCRQLTRKFITGPYDSHIGPRTFLAWAEQVSFEVHDEFLSHLRQYHDEAPESLQAPGANGQAAKKPDQREIDKIAQLFTALAIDGYGYRPLLGRSSIPNEIADIASAMGMEISTDTILKYLRHGAKFIPDGWEPTPG